MIVPAPRPGELPCSDHPETLAAWTCLGCEKALCEECGAWDIHHRMSLARCVHCGGVGQPVTFSARIEPLREAVPRFIRYLFTTMDAALQLAALTLVMAVIGIIPIFFFLPKVVLVAYYLLVVRHAADGEETLPEPSLESLGGASGAVLRFLVTGAFIILPTAGYLVWNDLLFEVDKWHKSPAFIALVVYSCVFAPAALIVASIGRDYVEMANPLAAVRVVLGVPRDYARVALIWTGTVVADLLFMGLIYWLASVAYVPILGWLVTLYLGLLIPVISAFILGRLIFEHGVDFGLRTPEDLLRRQVPDATPRGQLQLQRASDPDEPEVGLDLTDTELPLPLTLGEALAAEKREAAVAAWRELTAASKPLPTLPALQLITLAEALEGAREYTAAARAWSAAANDELDGPWAAAAIFGLAELLAGPLGKRDHARPLYQQLVDSFPEDPVSARAQERLGTDATVT